MPDDNRNPGTNPPGQTGRGASARFLRSAAMKSQDSTLA